MTEELKLVVEKEIAKLPKEGRDAIASVDWENISQVIGNKYLINEDEIAEMQLHRAKATGDAGVWKLPRGDEYYAWALRAGTTTRLSPQVAQAVARRRPRRSCRLR